MLVSGSPLVYPIGSSGSHFIGEIVPRIVHLERRQNSCSNQRLIVRTGLSGKDVGRQAFHIGVLVFFSDIARQLNSRQERVHLLDRIFRSACHVAGIPGQP